MTVWCLYTAFLALQIHGCGWINTIGHVAIVHYLVMNCQPSPLTLCPPATSVSLFLFGVCSDITELGLLITRWWLLVRSSLAMLRLMWCYRTVPGDVSDLPTIVTHWSLLLTSVL